MKNQKIIIKTQEMKKMQLKTKFYKNKQIKN